MIYMLNELSHIKVQSRQQVYGIMENFVYAATEAETVLMLKELRIDESLGRNLYDIHLMDNYSIGQWVNDNSVSPEIKGKFISIVSASPLVNEEEIKRFESENCFYNEKLGTGIKAALIYNTFCINFRTNDYIDITTLPIKHEYFFDGNIVCQDESIKCFASSLNVKIYLDWFKEFQKENLKRSCELWEKKNEFFPMLILCECVKNQIFGLGLSPNLINVIGRLRVLNNVASDWESGSFNYQVINTRYNITIHPESELTLSNYKQSRIFKLPNKSRVVFSLHIIVGDLRIHFYPDESNKKIYIGYIGHHLRTWNF